MYERAEKEIGNKYNHLSAKSINYEETEKHGKLYFDFECDCENKTIITRKFYDVKSGHIKSCGCIKFNNPKTIEDLTGKEFGRLTVIKRDIERDKKEGRVHWLCKCNCGSEKIISVEKSQLKSGHTQSCGCYAYEQRVKRNIKYSTKINSVIEEDDIIILLDDDDNRCVIDKEDYGTIKKWHWRKAEKRKNLDKGYWVASSKKNDGYDSSIIPLHQIIAEIKYGKYDTKELFPDHLSRDTNDNRKCNICLKSNQKNCHNRGLSKANTSGKTGVSYIENNHSWVAYITVNYKTIWLGEFDNIEDAIKIRIEAEKKYGFTCDNVVAPYDN